MSLSLRTKILNRCGICRITVVQCHCYLSSDNDDDFVEETVKMRLGSKVQKPTRQKRKVAESDSEDSVTLDKDGSGKYQVEVKSV